jgi:hypothetical protein
MCALVATTLAVESMAQKYVDVGMTEHQALKHIASTCALDVETLLRRRRLARKRQQVHHYGVAPYIFGGVSDPRAIAREVLLHEAWHHLNGGEGEPSNEELELCLYYH